MKASIRSLHPPICAAVRNSRDRFWSLLSIIKSREERAGHPYPVHLSYVCCQKNT
ncbi:hypothetical protein EVA_10837 [gut metagenome]|uniref:Uncharacterized protein n=1 Tax=gut metagenome TaxID=749906 RepID=J9CLU9_9ZZZZ